VDEMSETRKWMCKNIPDFDQCNPHWADELEALLNKHAAYCSQADAEKIASLEADLQNGNAAYIAMRNRCAGVEKEIAALEAEVLLTLGYGVSDRMYDAMKSLMEVAEDRCKELEAKNKEQLSELERWRSEHDPCPFQVRMEIAEDRCKVLEGKEKP